MSKTYSFIYLISAAVFLVPALYFGFSESTQEEAQASAQKTKIADVRRQLQNAKRGDIILYKDGSLCCITFVNAEEFRCLRFLGAVEESFVRSDDVAMSKISEVVANDAVGLRPDRYRDIAVQYLYQPLPH